MSAKRNDDLQLIYGRNPIIDAIAEGKSFERIYVRDSLTGEFEKEIRAKCKEHDIPLKKVPLIKLDKLSRNRNHQGVVGIGSIIEYQDISMVIPHLYEAGISPILFLLDNVQDVRNIGSIARSVEALGAHCIILSGRNAGMITHDSLKASAGALTRLHVCKEKNTIRVVENVKSHGIDVVGTSLGKGDPIHEVKLASPLCIVLGSENDGLHRSVEEVCDKLIKIPQSGSTQSLNVSVSAGIVSYEILRQSLSAS